MEDEVQYLEEDSRQDDSFLSNLNSTLSVRRDYESMKFDHEWLSMIETALPYIDNILRNPKRFIVNEEEIVKVELAKRVTVESVIHLSQHTNYIQDIDDNGDVKPSKILNINRDESLDTYENRFIYTLICNLRMFFEQRVAESGDSSYYMDKKDIAYEANTRVGTDEIHLHFSMNSIDKNMEDGSDGELSYADRLKRVKVQLDGFNGSELYQTLNKLHVAHVRSPIRKTNVILKNPNFQQAEILWNYIQSFVSKDKKEYQKLDYFDNSELKREYDHAILLTYIANRSLNEQRLGFSENKIFAEMIERLIENILDTDEEMTEDALKEMFNKQIKRIKQRNIEKSRAIYSIFVDRMIREKKRVKDRTLILKGDN